MRANRLYAYNIRGLPESRRRTDDVFWIAGVMAIESGGIYDDRMSKLREKNC